MKSLLIASLTLLLTSCAKDDLKPIHFQADWHHANTNVCALIPQEGDIVYCGDLRFNDFACMHKDKVAELVGLLRVAKVPSKYDDIVENVIIQLEKSIRISVP